MERKGNDQFVYSACLTDLSILQRKVKLKNQALILIRAERERLKDRLYLLRMRKYLLKRIGPEFDPLLSRKLDCIDFLLRDQG